MTINTSTHRSILIQILKDIYTDVTLGPVLGFKGGTAAYLFYGLGRFSVDLDFDLLDSSKADYVRARLETILKEYGVIREDYKKQNTIFFMLSYEEEAQNIKVEVNLRDFGSKFEVLQHLGISMKVMVREDMFAHKLVAMSERLGKSNRDIFDVWFFLKRNWPINKVIVKKRTVTSFKRFMMNCISALEKMPDRGILAGMGELLDAKQKAWAKENLRKDTIFLLKLKLEGEK